MKVLKRALSLFIVGLFVFTAFAVIQSGGGQAQASPSASSSFTFPYQYGTPTVPSDVGAQGIQGPNVPLSDIGATGVQGSSLKPLDLSTDDLTFSLLLYNGTVSTHSVAVGVGVSLYNYSRGVNLTVKTDSKGYANFTGLSAGPYFLETYPSSAYIPFGYWLSVFKSKSMTAYDIPSSYYNTSVGSGPDTVSISAAYPQEEIELYNVSGSSILGYSYADLIGNSLNTTFTGVHSNYTYQGIAISLNSLTDINYSTASSTTSTFTPTSTFYSTYFPVLASYDTSNATITGSQITNGDWDITQNTVVSNGTVMVNYGEIYIASGINLTFKHATLIVNGTDQYYLAQNGANLIPSHLYFNSSTLYFADNPYSNAYNPFNYVQFISFNNSYIFGDSLTSLLIGGSTIQFGFNVPNDVWVNSSYMYGFDSVDQYGFNSYNSYLENSTFIPLSAHYDTFLNTTFHYNSGNTASNTFPFNMSVEHSLFTGIFTGEGINENYSYHDTYKDNLFTHFIPADASLGEGSMVFQHNTVIASYPSYLNFNSTISYYGQKYGLYNNGGGVVFVSGNISFNIFIRETPSVGNFATYGSYNVYDNYMVSNITENQFISFSNDNRIANSTDSWAGEPLAMNAQSGYWQNVSYNYISNTELISTSTHTSFTHNYWANQISFLTSNELTASNIQNNTFGSIEDWGSSIVPYEDHYFNNVYNGINGYSLPGMIIKNNSFYGFTPGGVGNGGTGPGSNRGAWTIETGNGNATVINNVFYNDEFSGELNLNDSSIGADVVSYGSYSLVMEGNWFLNLNNMSIPFYINNQTASISNNHFFYASFDGFPATLTSLSHDHLYQNDTYAFLVTNVTGIGTSSQYYFNSSVKTGYQQLYYFSGPPADGGYFVYQVAPDVNALSGTPIISYSNGLVGGPQPNFTWKGYNYSESVEPTYIQVGVNSSKAPPVNLQFSGIPGIKYLVQAFSQGSEFESFVENASSSGILNATYNPATMPLDPTFEVSPYVAPLPPYNPVQPNPPMNFFPTYVFYILLATSAAGVAAGIYILIRRR